MRNVMITILTAVATLGPCLVIAAASFASITALGRNPSSAPKIMMAMIIALLFAEAIAIIALLIIFQVFTP